MPLFDAGQQNEESSRKKALEHRQKELERTLAELKETDEASSRLGKALGGHASIQAVRYQTTRRKGSKWQLEHAAVGSDYVIQCFALKPTTMNWRDVLSHMIMAIDRVFPRSVEVFYRPPSAEAMGDTSPLATRFYTIRLKNVVELPGFERAKEKTLEGLLDIAAW